MSKLKVFILNTLTSVIASILFRIAFLWFNIFVSNKVGAESMGVYSLIMSVYTVLIAISASGLNLAASRITAEEIARGNDKSAIKNVYNCITFGLLCSFCACVIIFTFNEPIAKILLHGKVHSSTVKKLCISLPFISVSSAISGYFTAIRQAYKMSLVQFFENFSEIAVAVILLNIIPCVDADGICLILILSNAFSKILAFIIHISLFYIEIKKPKSVGKGTNTIKRMFKIVLPVAVSSHIKSALSGLKHTLVPLKLEKYTNNCETAIGEYGKINAMAMPIITFPCCLFTSIANLLVPEIASLCVLKQSKKIAAILSKIYKYTIIISVYTISILILYGCEMGDIFYKNRAVGRYIMYLAPIIPFIYYDCTVDAVLKGIDKQIWVVLINITDTIICIILINFILPVMGTTGYILIIYISEIYNGITSNLILKRSLKYKTDTANSIIKPAVSAIVSASVLKLFNLNTISSFIVFSFLYTLILFILKAVKKDEIKIIAKM